MIDRTRTRLFSEAYVDVLTSKFSVVLYSISLVSRLVRAILPGTSDPAFSALHPFSRCSRALTLIGNWHLRGSNLIQFYDQSILPTNPRVFPGNFRTAELSKFGRWTTNQVGDRLTRKTNLRVSFPYPSASSPALTTLEAQVKSADMVTKTLHIIG